MSKPNPQTKFPSELRFDLISKDWVVIATGRARRPETFKQERRKEEIVPKKSCPFCNLEEEVKPALVYYQGKQVKSPKKWTTVVVSNKFPAFLPNPKLQKKTEGGIYQAMNAVGFHEVVVTRDHKKSIAQFSLNQAKELFDVYHQRYLDLAEKKFVNYVSIFHNHGKEAGASVAHPHSQIITTPLIDTDLIKALENSEQHFKRTGQCIYCRMNIWEKKVKTRIVFENKDFLAVCPFASKSAFEVIISPKKHLAYFEKITQEEKWQLSEAFQVVLKKIYKALNDPAYNFYLHTAPSDQGKYPYYHWHWTILPKTSTWAGFEIGTRMEISTIEPERAAEYLRKQ